MSTDADGITMTKLLGLGWKRTRTGARFSGPKINIRIELKELLGLEEHRAVIELGNAASCMRESGRGPQTMTELRSLHDFISNFN